MGINDYQKQALTTDTYKTNIPANITDLAFINKILGLVGESGEVAEKFKKIIRNNNGQMDDAERQEVIKELGDVLWYIATISHYLGYELHEVAQANLNKLADRKNRGVLKSQGDNR